MLYMTGLECLQGLWLKQVEEEMEEIYLALDSSLSRPQKHEHLSSGSPLPQDPVPPPGPAAGWWPALVTAGQWLRRLGLGTGRQRHR